MKLPLRALAIPLLALLTSRSVPATPPSEVLTVTVEAFAPAPGGEQACEVAFEGRHGGATGQIAVDFGESQVRTRVGWWAAIPHRGAARTAVTLTPGGRFSEAYRLDLGCNAHRRYRFEIAASDGAQRYEHTFYYPSEDGFTQETFIDLGALARHFEWIPTAPDAEPQPVTLEGFSLDGEWVRYESTYDPNDGMRITVDRDQATITSVPESVHPAFREGSVIWRDIAGDGTLRTFGSDGIYYPARLTPEGADRLHVDISNSGPGNDQTWVRAEGCWPNAYMAGYEAPAPDMWVRFSTALPDGFQNALRAARDARAPIQTAALSPSGEWVVVAANRPCYSAGFPADAREWIDRYIASGREIDVVAFGPGGRWLVVAEDYIRRATNVSDAVVEDFRHAQGLDRRATSFAFSDDPDAGWVLTAGGGLYAHTAFDPNIREAMAAANAGQRPIHEVAIAPGGAWVLVAEDWFASRGAPDGLREWLERYRTDEGRRIDHVVLHPDGDRLLWAIISNAPEPAPDAADLVNRVEHGLPGDSTIYQRMKRHGITGLSIALVQNNEVAWARGYGLREFDLPESYVYPKTVFDAASISKPVSYAAALQLVDAGALTLTEAGVLLDLAGDELPDRSTLEEIRADEIHLAHLLAHCAGIDNEKGVSGAQEVGMGDPVPTIAQIFLGEAPAAAGNRIVKVDTLAVGEMTDYSGANSILIQALVEDAADGGYDGQMERLFDALDMHRSRVDHDFWRTMQREWFARGHWTDSTGTTTKADVKVYPNQAAAALRTTASDLAHFVIMLNQGGLYDGTRVMEAATVDRFIGRDGVGPTEGVAEAACAQRGSMQLGIRASGLGLNRERYWHGGLHNGYRTYLSGVPPQQGGIVLLITGRLANADALRDEIRAAVRTAYGWPAL